MAFIWYTSTFAENGRDVMKISEKRWFQWGVGLALILVILWLLSEDQFIFTPVIIFVKTLFLPFLLAGVLFYLTRPLVQLLEHIHIPRKLAILIIFLIIAGFLTLVISWLSPIIQAQFQRLINNFPDMINSIQDALTYWQQNQDSVPKFVSDAVNSGIEQLKDYITSVGSSIGTYITDTITGTISLILSLIVVPFVLFYLLDDRDKFVPSLSRFFPKARKKDIRKVLQDTDQAIANYIQGQLIVSTFVALMLLIGYFIIDLNYALLLALFGMVTNIIPFLGPFIAVTPAIIVAWFQDPIMVVYVAIITLVAQQLEGNLVTPQVMGRQLNVHPLTIILLVLVGGQLAGIIGMILIIPMYAVVKVLIQHGYRIFRLNRRKDS